jgi:hypothetical protein
LEAKGVSVADNVPIKWSIPQGFPQSLVVLIDQIFGDNFLVSHNRLAKGLGKKPGVLKDHGDFGMLNFRLDGARRVYAREDVAAYLARKSAGQTVAPRADSADASLVSIKVSSSNFRTREPFEFTARRALAGGKTPKLARMRR